MGAIVTHALVNEEGTLIVAAESGQIIIWDLATKKVIYSDECSHIVQMAFNKQQTKEYLRQISIWALCTHVVRESQTLTLQKRCDILNAQQRAGTLQHRMG